MNARMRFLGSWGILIKISMRFISVYRLQIHHFLPIPLRILDLAFRALTDIAARIDHIDGLVLFIIPAGDARISEKGVAGRADDVVVFQFGLDCQGCHCIIFSRGIQINTPL